MTSSDPRDESRLSPDETPVDAPPATPGPDGDLPSAFAEPGGEPVMPSGFTEPAGEAGQPTGSIAGEPVTGAGPEDDLGSVSPREHDQEPIRQTTDITADPFTIGDQFVERDEAAGSSAPSGDGDEPTRPMEVDDLLTSPQRPADLGGGETTSLTGVDPLVGTPEDHTPEDEFGAGTNAGSAAEAVSQLERDGVGDDIAAIYVQGADQDARALTGTSSEPVMENEPEQGAAHGAPVATPDPWSRIVSESSSTAAGTGTTRREERLIERELDSPPPMREEAPPRSREQEFEPRRDERAREPFSADRGRSDDRERYRGDDRPRDDRPRDDRPRDDRPRDDRPRDDRPRDDRPRDDRPRDDRPRPDDRRDGDGDRYAARERSIERAPERATVAVVDEPMSPTFEDLGLSGALLRSIKEVGYEEPTPIQIATIPALIEGADVIAQAQTGSGKTAAFGFPIIESIDPRLRKVQAMILCPTRELAIQVSEALHKYGRHKEVETLPIYGGQAYERQFRGLQRGVQIVVGTPGRVMDHMRRGTLDLDALAFFVLDEADEMLDMGFIEDIEWILQQVPASRQTALFSATMPPRIVDLARTHMREPRRISVAGKQMTVPETRQTYFEVPRSRKTDALTRILDAEEPGSAMIFCRTKHQVDELGESLLARGYAVETLHGDLSQAQRDRVMRRFRGNQADILIATDVAARGLDIPEVSHVINYDIPESAEAYVHRIGRTGRAGRTGEAITLITPRETRWLRQIERIVKAPIEPRRLPTLSDVAERRREAMKQQIEEVLKNADQFAPYVEVVDSLTDDRDAVEVAAAILKLYADETGRATPENLKEDDLATFSTADRGRRETGMVRLFVNIGRIQGVRPQDMVGAIANEAGIPGRSIGAIDILDAYTYVDVPADVSDRVVTALNTTSIKGRAVSAEVAPQGSGRPAREDRGGPGGGGGRQNDRFGGGRGDRPPGGGNRFGGGPRRDDDRFRGDRNERSRGAGSVRFPDDRGPRPAPEGGAPRNDRPWTERPPAGDEPRFNRERNDRPDAPARTDRPFRDRDDRPPFRARDDRGGPPRRPAEGPDNRSFDRGPRPLRDDDRGPRPARDDDRAPRPARDDDRGFRQ